MAINKDIIVRCITVYVKPDRADEFIAATKENRKGSIREPGILRFDVLRSPADPGEFFLYEAYVNEEATHLHKETSHYLVWKEKVTPLMDRDRIGKAYIPVDPVLEEEW